MNLGKKISPKHTHHIYIEEEGKDKEIDIKFPFKPKKY
jgi:hypothetical protein